MNPIKRILAATDLSENAEVALQSAALLASLTEAELCVAHVIPNSDPSFASLVRKTTEQLEARAKKDIQATKLKKAPAKLSIIVEQGDPATRILEIAQRLNADVTVAGTRGRSADDLNSIGGVAERIALSAASDVLLVRPDHKKFSRICVAMDFSDLSVMALDRAVELAGLYDVKKLSLLHVIHIPDEYWLTGISESESLKRMENFAKEHLAECQAKIKTSGLKIEPVFEEGKPHDGLATLTKMQRADLLVMGSHGQSKASHAMLGSVAAKTIRQTPASIWIETDPQFKRGFLKAIGKIMGLAD